MTSLQCHSPEDCDLTVYVSQNLLNQCEMNSTTGGHNFQQLL